jgi:hypothetical protein
MLHHNTPPRTHIEAADTGAASLRSILVLVLITQPTGAGRAIVKPTNTPQHIKTRTRPGAGFFISGPGFRRNHHEQRQLQNLDQHRHDAS